MTDDEVEWLTRAMIESGDTIEFDTHPIMDKHSIGGVPVIRSLLVVPIVAANGFLFRKQVPGRSQGQAGLPTSWSALSC